MTDFSSDSRIKPSVKGLHTEDLACVEIIAQRNDHLTKNKPSNFLSLRPQQWFAKRSRNCARYGKTSVNTFTGIDNLLFLVKMFLYHTIITVILTVMMVWWFNQLVFRSGHLGKNGMCLWNRGKWTSCGRFLVGKCNLILLNIQVLVINVFEATCTIRGEREEEHPLA